MNHCVIDDSKMQKPNIYNKYSPFYESIKQQGIMLFDEIRENLSRTIQLGELEPGFVIWSDKLSRFISLYGFYFTKMDHLKLIHLYLSVLSIVDLDYSYVDTCFNMLFELLRKTRLITRDDLIIDWRIFYTWAQLIEDNHDKQHSLVILPKDISISLYICLCRCSLYFSATATQEILDELRPRICPFDLSFGDIMKMFSRFLPINLPRDLHDQGFKLWLPEFFDLWETIYNHLPGEIYFARIFASLTWNNIGCINWEPWLSQIFTRIHRSFSLPIGKIQLSSRHQIYLISDLTQWIVAMIGNGSLCLEYLRDLLFSMKSFYHPSNTGKFQEDLIKFILNLAERFVNRLHLERKAHPVWFFAPQESSRLTEQDITNFVNCLKDYAFMSIFNKDYVEEAAEACKYLSTLRPELIVPMIIENHFSSIDNLTEPHRFTSIITCLTHIARQIVQQTPSYSQGQLYVLPLLMSVLPGIDLNDLDKTLLIFKFLDTILMYITCVDCSSAVNTRSDLTETEKEVCLSTQKFEDFINEFLNRIFQMIDILSADVSDGVMSHTDDSTTDTDIKSKLTSIILNIVQQCSNKLFQKIREKMMKFIGGVYFSSKVRDIVCSLVQALVKGNPIETLHYLLPTTCKSIEKILNNSASILTDHKDDMELNWYLSLFTELLYARGDTLLMYKEMIISVFHQCIHIINKDAYETLANAITYLLESLTQIYPIDYRLTVENINEPFIDCLPIRIWGQYVDIDKLQVQFHIPNMDEINFVSEFINTFLYPELSLLNENTFKMSNNERLRSITLIESFARGCFRMVPRIDSAPVPDLIPSVVPYNSNYHVQFSINSKQLSSLEFHENLRIRLLNDIGTLLDKLIENHSDDVLSIKRALTIYPLISIYYGINNNIYNFRKEVRSREMLAKNKLCGEGQNIRCLIIERMGMKIEELELNNFGILNDIDKQIILKLFQLSINRYSAIRLKAQAELFGILKYYNFSFQVVVNRIVELLNTAGASDHDQIKGCLYILLGNRLFSFPTKYSWTMKEKLWPLIVRMSHGKKNSTQKLVEDIYKHICKHFATQVIIQNTNEKSIQAAAALWRPLESSERLSCEEPNRINIQSYTALTKTLCLQLKDINLTWGQQKMTLSFLCLLLQKKVPMPSICIRIFVDFLVHDNMELRKFAIQGIAAFCRLQKPSRIYVEKSLKEILHNTGKPLPNIVDNECQPGDRIDNLWVTMDNYIPPETQIEWEQTCFLDKSFHGYYTWPKMIKYPMNKRTRYTPDTMPGEVSILYEYFNDKDFVAKATQLMVLDENDNEDEKNFDDKQFTLFKGLFRNFGMAFIDNFMEQLYVLVHEKIREKESGSHRVAAEIVAGMIRGSKHWTLEMINELWQKLTPFLTEVCNNLSWETLFYWNTCFIHSIENEDPRRMYRVIDFIFTLIDTTKTSNLFNEAAHWSLIRRLEQFQWRIPSIWCELIQHAKILIDHPAVDVRDGIANLFATAFNFDLVLFNRKSTRQPDLNQFIDDICKRLDQAIEIYENVPLLTISDQGIAIDSEARKALNFIQTVVCMHKRFFFVCRQPIKHAIIRLFPYLCEIENITINDEIFRKNLITSRLYLAMSYFNTHFLEALIQQLVQISTSRKWHVRRVAIEFLQNIIFCNLFNARPYAKQLHELVFKCLFDDQYEVRIVASTTLSGFYQCGYIEITNEDLSYFRAMSKTNYFTKVNGKKVTLTNNIIKRHGGILGLCAIILSSPYDIPVHVPDALMLLCEHLHDPDLIQKSIRRCLLEFRRTHHDSWHQHRQQFNEDQLIILADILISHNYYI